MNYFIQNNGGTGKALAPERERLGERQETGTGE